MAFESLTERLSGIFKKMRGQARLTEANMDDMLREIRVALLEADVNYKVVKEFINNIKEKAIGQDVLGKLNPSQMIVKIVHDEFLAVGEEVAVAVQIRIGGIVDVEAITLLPFVRDAIAVRIVNHLHFALLLLVAYGAHLLLRRNRRGALGAIHAALAGQITGLLLRNCRKLERIASDPQEILVQLHIHLLHAGRRIRRQFRDVAGHAFFVAAQHQKRDAATERQQTNQQHHHLLQ